MKIALPSRDGNIDDHFGHCSYYTIITVDNGIITEEQTMDSPEGCGCKSNIAPLLAQAGVKIMLAGNMGDGALNVLNTNGIEVIRGCSGTVKDVANAWLSGELQDSLKSCSHTHEDGHVCGHK